MSEPIGPGDKVECIDNSDVPDLLTKGGIYRVTRIARGWVYLALPGIAAGGWSPKRFRPIRSIEVFRHIDADVFNRVNA